MLSRAELHEARHLLHGLLDRLDRERAELSEEAFGAGGEEGSGCDVPRRPDEQGGVRLTEEVIRGLMQNGDCLRAQIRAALDSLDAGTYGACDQCGRPISERRLRAVPYAVRCIRCARMIEHATGR